MRIFDRNFKEIFYSQLFSLAGGLFGGTLLAIYTDKMLIIPGMLILIPGFLEMRGNISGSFASRLSSGLFLHVINPNHKKSRLIKGNLIASFSLAIIVSLAIGLLAFGFNGIYGNYTPEIIWIPLIAGIISNLIQLPLALGATLYIFKKGHDPNNIMGPFITSTGDVISILSLLLAVMII